MPRLFGTDGVRGVANADLTPELALRIGRAVVAVLRETEAPHKQIVIGRDTRISGPMLEAAMVAGITSAGRDALTLGIVPTPGVAAITRYVGAAAGIAISASHNPVEDNGIKLFSGDGYKLTDEQERRLEKEMAHDDAPRPTHGDVGGAAPVPEFVERYVDDLVAAGTSLAGLTTVVDCAFGAAYRVVPAALRRLGADVVTVNDAPDGCRINVHCGSTDLGCLKNAVRDISAARKEAHVVGVAFDGDADRALFIDESGATVSGDHVLLALTRERKARGALARDCVVATVMSNMGLERALAADGVALLRTPVGDRYVLEAMREGGYVLGGEQSGHIIDLERNTTGDGPLTCVLLLSLLSRAGTTLRELVGDLHVYPQVLVNVRSSDPSIVERDAGVRAAIDRAERDLDGEGRVLVRPSGTEPLIRVMVESKDAGTTDRLARAIAGAIEAASRRV